MIRAGHSGPGGRIAALLAASTAALASGACAHRSPAANTASTPVPAESDVFPSSPPALGPVRPLRVPAADTRSLANGLRIVVVEQHELPLVDLVLVVRSGVEADPPASPGTATMTAAMLLEGTSTRSSIQIADQKALLGVSLDAAAAWDASTLVLHTPTARLDSSLTLLADVALHPTFPERELSRLRAERLTALLQRRDEPAEVADVAFPVAVYGASHPYGHSGLGDSASTTSMTEQGVRTFHATHWRPNDAVLLVVGDVTAGDIERRARLAFGGWTRSEVARAVVPEPPTTQPTSILLVDKPGAEQSSVRLGGVGAARGSGDYYTLAVLNTILGGAFTSRLNVNLRETHGYSYGAGSNFSSRRSAGPFQAGAEVVSAKTDSALLEFVKELRAIRDTVPRDELAKAKRYLQLQLPGRFETTGGIAAQLVPLLVYDLPTDFYDRYAERIAAVTQADVQRVARHYVRPDSLTVVIVGDRKSIEPGLIATRVGPVRVRSVGEVAR